MRGTDYLGTPRRLPAGPAVLLRLAGIGFMIWLNVYMWQCCRRGEYFRDDPVLTIFILMFFAAGTVFGTFCTWQRWRGRNIRPSAAEQGRPDPGMDA